MFPDELSTRGNAVSTSQVKSNAAVAPVPWDMPTKAQLLECHCACERREFRRGDYIFRRGEPFQALCILDEGIVKKSLAGIDGVEITRSFRVAGDILGLDSMGSSIHQFDVRALCNVSLSEFRYSSILAACSRNQALGDRLTRAKASEIMRFRCWLTAMQVLRATERIGLFLREISLHDHTHCLTRALLRRSRREISRFLGVSSRQFTESLQQLPPGMAP